ncbi:MAG: ribosome maturation factor RimM [Proteobacteria bacterium]|jgi:16S rRNA processing protein RimM|nr:ribosome maturation factor RimM [Pseudomonadota bacterium]
MVPLGHVSGLFGVKGWLRIHSDTEPRANILNYTPWYLQKQGEWVACKVAEGQAHGKGLIVRLDACTDRDSAAKLVGCTIAIRREQLPAAGENEYYWSDLKGLSVIARDGTPLGTVTGLIETGANDVLLVRDTHDAEVRERLIPYLPGQVVLNVELEKGVLTVDWDPEF